MTAHGTHCCKIHGCKYEDEDCPDVLGTEKGIQCEECQGAIRVMEQFDKEMQFEVSEIKDWMEDGSNPTRSMVEFLLAEVDRLSGKLERTEAHWNDWAERCAIADLKLRAAAQLIDEGKEREKILQDALERIVSEGFRDKLLEHIATEALANAEKLRR